MTYLENLRLIIFFSNKRFLSYENISLFIIFFLNSNELLRVIIIFIYIFIQLSIVLSLFFSHKYIDKFCARFYTNLLL